MPDTLMRRRAGLAVAGLLALDGLAHLYWATGATWPARGERGLSLAVLGGVVSFAPRVVLPLAAVTLLAAACVLAYTYRRGGPLPALVTYAVAAGLLVRGLLGVVWAGDGAAGEAFRWLNLLVYTPVCLGFGLAAASLLTWRSWVRGTALGLPLVLAAVAAYGAYGYAPAERPAPVLADSRFVETPAARFHYLRQGQGSPVVLVSPGASWSFAWRHQLDLLSRTHTVYVVDLPGQGPTRLKDRTLTWDLNGMTAALGSFLDALGLDRVALAGNSWSGGWALAYAQRHPERVSRLVLLASSGLDEKDPPLWEALKLPLVGELLTHLGAGRDAAASSVRGLFVHKELATDEVVDAAWGPAAVPDNLRSVYRLERGLDWSVTQRALPETRLPVLVVWGRQDGVLPVAQAARFGRLLPDARVRELDGCGHALTLDCPAPVGRLMEEFLRDTR
ncbi:alpha/beta fold hydrolase [Streptomyces sp.]|uniref:alpha/beta fold hydrolase n=1 Tax=Streptomyces sp. TaxID=1931 RepID=UPI002F921653